MRSRPQLLLLAATLAASAAATPLLGARAEANDHVVVVRPGQTLSEIALHEGVSVAELVALNGLPDPDRILAGQRLQVRREDAPTAPAAPPAAAPPATPAAVTHRVAWGETLSGIAARYGVGVAAIARANGIANTSFIREGQLLAIPGAATPPAAATAPAAGPSRLGGPTAAMSADMAAVVARRQAIGSLIVAEADRQGVPAAFALAVAWQESGWRPGVVSSAGAIGVMQLLPATGEWVGDTMLGAPVNLWDPASNVRAGVRLLRHYLDRYGGSRELALAAYYQGQTAADRHGIYNVSRPYIASILSLERLFGG